MNFTDTEQRLLDRIQVSVPLAERPYRELGNELGISEQEVLSIVGSLKRREVIRNISAIFNTPAMGYRSSLVALEVPEEKIPFAAGIINSHPGVSHNYLRDHRYNIWFTLSLEKDKSLDGEVRYTAERCGARDFLVLNNEKQYKIRLFLKTGGADNRAENTEGLDSGADNEMSFSESEKDAIRLLQCDLPLEKEPFHLLVELNFSTLAVKELLNSARSLKENGVLRRYAAVLRHRRAGYHANAMTVWKPVDDRELEKAAEIFKQEQNISHLYRRTVYPGKWEYPLFAMVHEKDDESLNRTVERFSLASGITDYLVLRSLQEFKKERVVYFSEKHSNWNSNGGNS